MDDLTLPAAIAAFITATNAADSDQFVAQFTPDAVLDDWGTTYNGPAEMQVESNRQHRQTIALRAGRFHAG